MKVSIIMGSTSDYDTMSGAEQMLAEGRINLELYRKYKEKTR